MCNYWIDGASIDLGYILGQMTFLKYVPMTASWYMPMILGVYLFIPFIANAIHKTEPQILLFPLTIGYIYYFIVPTLQLLFPSLQLLNRLDLSFGGTTYGIYVLMGYTYCKYNKKQIHLLTKTFLFLPMLTFTVFVQLYFLHMGTPNNVWYTQALIPLMGLLLFSSLNKFDYLPLRRLCTTISFCSFGIYLIHIPILNTLSHIISFQNTRHPVRVVIFWGLTFAFSFLIVFCLSKIKKARKILFNMDAHQKENNTVKL